jgi:tetratricopeptide (TPR) repeat protein
LLELAIVICVAAILFLLLRSYSNVGKNTEGAKEGIMENILKKLFAQRRKRVEDEIIESLHGSNSGIVSPKEIDDAQKHFETTDPELAKFLYEASEAFERGDFNEVEEKAIAAIGRDKRCDQAYSYIAACAIEKKNEKDAEEALSIALKCNPENALAHALFGQLLYDKEKYSESIEHFQKAVNLDRNRADWQAGLGKAFMEVRQYAKASKALKRAATLNIDNAEYKKLALEAEEKQRAHSQVAR